MNITAKITFSNVDEHLAFLACSDAIMYAVDDLDKVKVGMTFTVNPTNWLALHDLAVLLESASKIQLGLDNAIEAGGFLEPGYAD